MNIDYVSKIISDGGVAVIPTDTVYGIVADATNYDAVKKAYEVKKRDYSKPMILLVSNYEMLNNYVKDISNFELELMNNYWPGELTILLKRNENVLDIVTNGGELVGIRIPNNKTLIELIDKVGKPLISTSANISKKETITDISMLEQSLLDNVDYIYDGGKLTGSASTIIRIIDDMIVILRAGNLAKEIEEKYKLY